MTLYLSVLCSFFLAMLVLSQVWAHHSLFIHLPIGGLLLLMFRCFQFWMMKNEAFAYNF